MRRPTALGKDDVQGRRAALATRPSCGATGRALEMPSTSHFVIVDADGNVAVDDHVGREAFGSRLMVDGFLLNNQLTDFAFAPGPHGAAVANRVEPGKRPRSSMAPTIVLEGRQAGLALGSPGGSRDHPVRGHDADRADRLEDGHAGGGLACRISSTASAPTTSSRAPSAEALADDLDALGYKAAAKEMNSGLNGIAIGAGRPDGRRRSQARRRARSATSQSCRLFTDPRHCRSGRSAAGKLRSCGMRWKSLHVLQPARGP